VIGEQIIQEPKIRGRSCYLSKADSANSHFKLSQTEDFLQLYMENKYTCVHIVIGRSGRAVEVHDSRE
jgi:hypothetical protein